MVAHRVQRLEPEADHRLTDLLLRRATHETATPVEQPAEPLADPVGVVLTAHHGHGEGQRDQ
jgi:hypothetical protein